MVDDALGELPTGTDPVEIRDGVAIDLATRTAEVDERGKGFKYDIELLTTGTTFPLRFEFWRPKDTADLNGQQLLEAFALALRGFETGRIGLGMRKRRGFGQCRVVEWRVWRYPMDNVAGVIGWLTHGDQADRSERGTDILDLLKVDVSENHRGETFVIDASFRLCDSLLIRADSGQPDAPDMVHLRSWRPDQKKAMPVLSGTSLAGAIRGRVSRIANTLKGETEARRLVDGIFGRRIRSHKDEPSGSRLLVREAVIQNAITDRVQNRVKLDRFSGGAYPQALFSQQPIFAKAAEPTRVNVLLELRRRNGVDEKDFHAEIGLLLLLLKDLWTGDLPLGGESSVGRGRLQGLTATLTQGETTWTISQRLDGTLDFGGNGNPADLEETYLQVLLQEVEA
jgi:CRISPR/Cas system CSM-associated protein Csm3 (group 7 of RAMP superfamily)